MLFQLTNKHKGINKVVKRIKNNEMPSIPNVKLKFNNDIHKNLLTYWKTPTDLSKKNHKNNERIKIKHVSWSDIIFKNGLLYDGVSDKRKIPPNGNNKIITNKFLRQNINLKL